MNIERLMKKLVEHEGVSRFVYDDHLGYATIGVGRCVEKNVGLGLSDSEIDFLLENDIHRCVTELRRAFDWFDQLDSIRAEAMVNLCFNLGLSRLLGFKKALAHMAEKNYSKAADEFYDSKWQKQVGYRADEVCDMIRHGNDIERNQ
jgi:lysozyme